MLLSCFAKKVTKEVGIGEALSVALPRAKAALSYEPLPARTWRLRRTLTGKTFRFSGFPKADCYTTSALPKKRISEERGERSPRYQLGQIPLQF